MDIHIFEGPAIDIPESKYIPLNVISDYSCGYSIATIDSLISKAKSLNMKALALTDRTLAGAIEFYMKCFANDIKPIIGQKICFDSSGVILLCKDFEAYKILCRHSLELENMLELNGELPLSEEECKHFICITQEYQNEYLQKVFESDLFAELVFYKLNADDDYRNRVLEKTENIQSVLTNEIHFLEQEDVEVLEFLRSAKTGSFEKLRSQEYFVSDKEILPFVEKMNRLDLVENTKKIADSIPYIFPEDYFSSKEMCRRMMESLPDCENGEELLRTLVNQGLEKRNLVVDYAAVQRAKYEVQDIIARGFTNLFLFQHELTSWCREKNIVYGPGRGADAGSLVAYLLEITDVNPLEYGLLYERFVNPDRITYPDFDIDYDYEKLDDIVSHLKEKYGKDHVARIATYARLNAKTAIQSAGKGLGFSDEEINSVTDSIPNSRRITLQKLMAGSCFREKGEEEPSWKISWWDGVKIKGFFRDKKYEKLIQIAQKLEGVINIQSLHACGYIVTKEPVCNYAPVLIDKSRGLYCEYSLDETDLCGLYKTDILGLIELTKLEKIRALVQKSNPDFDYKTIPLDDKKTLKGFEKAQTDDVFQFESEGMKEILRKVKPNSFTDLVMLNAMYRPGIMDYIPYVIDAKCNPEIIHYPDPSLEEILKETYGAMVYQEQVMQSAQRIAGYSLGGADLLRRAMGRRSPEVLMNKKLEFIDGAIINGFTEQNAATIFEIMIPFAGYGFNKSHSVAYTKIAFWDMYLKVHFRDEYEQIVDEMHDLDQEEEDWL